MNTPKLELVTFSLCPYVQRSIIILEEKGIPHTRIDIDLANKPAWFTRLSPMGKVPLLVVDDNRPLFESAVICEFLDEITPDSLFPKNALIKAYHKAWIEFGSQILNKIAYLYSVHTEAEFKHALVDLRHHFERLEPEIVLEPYFTGSEFLLIDAAYAPIFRYFDVFDRYFDTGVFNKLSKVSRWRISLMKRSSVKKAVRNNYMPLLTDFLVKKDSYISGLIK